jgi:hypothetical protein
MREDVAIIFSIMARRTAIPLPNAVAREVGIPAAEQSRMADAFRVAEAK